MLFVKNAEECYSNKLLQYIERITFIEKNAIIWPNRIIKVR
jgi:hypothetical protein